MTMDKSRTLTLDQTNIDLLNEEEEIMPPDREL